MQLVSGENRHASVNNNEPDNTPLRSARYILSDVKTLARAPTEPEPEPDQALRKAHRSVSHLYARLPLLCVIRDVEQVPEALVGDKLVACGDDARVSP